MVSLLLQPLVCSNIIEWFFLIYVPIGCKYVNIIFRFEPLHQVDNGTDGPTSFKGWSIPIAEYEEFCFYGQLFMVKLYFLNPVFLEPVAKYHKLPKLHPTNSRIML